MSWLIEYTPLLLRGTLVTILLAVAGTFGGFLLSLLFVNAKTQVIDEKRDNFWQRFSKKFFKGFATFYITIFRGTPMIVQAMILYYGIQAITGWEFWTPLLAGFIIVILNTTAYIAEIIRGSVNAIDPGQMEAARSLGFSRKKAMYLIVFPQAIKNSLPSIGNEFIVNLKDSAVLSVIGLLDLFNATRQVVGKTYLAVAPYVVTAIIYLILTSVTSLIVHKLENKQKKEVVSND
ncbi:MAG: amino acid ABC transporter permease [Acholeplasma sp.]|nr:amino acid ABC transporter permease [Acholeplasma sp.]